MTSAGPAISTVQPRSMRPSVSEATCRRMPPVDGPSTCRTRFALVRQSRRPIVSHTGLRRSIATTVRGRGPPSSAVAARYSADPTTLAAASTVSDPTRVDGSDGVGDPPHRGTGDGCCAGRRGDRSQHVGSLAGG